VIQQQIDFKGAVLKIYSEKGECEVEEMKVTISLVCKKKKSALF
jgi:hypothetical protein